MGNKVVVKLVLIIMLGVLVLPSTLIAAPPKARWTWCMKKGSGVSMLASVTADAVGVYAVGSVNGGPDPFDLGNGVKVRGMHSEQANALLMRCLSDGTVLWARSPERAAARSNFTSVAIDSFGNVYAAGSIGEGRIDFGNGVLVSGIASPGNAVLVKFNSSGTAQWARTVTTAEDESMFSSLTVDSSGDVYVGGKIGRGVFEFGGDVSATGGSDSNGSIVVLRYDPSGSVRWARSVPTKGGDRWGLDLLSMAIDSAGGLYGAGWCGSETFDFGDGITVKGPGAYNALLVKYNHSGTVQWAKTVEAGVGGSWFLTVNVDVSGNVIAAGVCGSRMTYDFGSGVTVRGAYNVENALLVKFNSQGTAIWARSVVEASRSTGYRSVGTDAAGNVYVAANAPSTTTLGFGNGVTATGSYWGFRTDSGENALVVKYDASGTAQWAQSVTAASTNSVYNALAVDAAGSLYAVGYIGTDIVTFAPGVTAGSEASTYNNAVMVKY